MDSGKSVQLLWLSVFAGSALFFVQVGVFWLLRARKRRREAMLRRRVAGQQGHSADQGGIRIRGLGASEGLGGIKQRLSQQLERAGLTLSAGSFALRVATGTIMLALLSGTYFESWTTGLVFFIASLVVSWLFVNQRVERQRKLLADQLPQALELMIFSLRAGNAIEQALKLAADELPSPLSAELLRCHQETQMGRPFEDALKQLRVRWSQVSALGAFVEAVTVARQSGGNIVEVMETIIASTAAQSAYEARYRALTSEGRSAGLILTLLPLLLLVLQTVMAPDELKRLAVDGTGRMLLATSAGLWLLGALWVRRLTKA